MEAEFTKVFKKMQADTRKEFDIMQQKFAKKEKELDAAFAKSKIIASYVTKCSHSQIIYLSLFLMVFLKGEAKLNEHYAETEKRLEVETKAKIKEMEDNMKLFCETTRKETVQNFKFSKDQMDMFVKDQVKEIKRVEQEAIANLGAKTLQYKKEAEEKVNMARQELINIVEQRTANHLKQISGECVKNKQDMSGMVEALQKRLTVLEEMVRTKLEEENKV